MDAALETWPETREDRLLDSYHRAHGGTLYLEVGVGSPDGPGHWPPGSRERLIDGVLVLGEENNEPVRWRGVKNRFASVVAGRGVHILEAKPRLGRTVIGQVIVAVDMFKRTYPGVASLGAVAVVEKTDPATAWWCERHHVSVWSPR